MVVIKHVEVETIFETKPEGAGMKGRVRGAKGSRVRVKRKKRSEAEKGTDRFTMGSAFQALFACSPLNP